MQRPNYKKNVKKPKLPDYKQRKKNKKELKLKRLFRKQKMSRLRLPVSKS